jgi:hypothetical protein
LIGDQKHTYHITKEQYKNRHADQHYVFYFLPIAQNILKFYASRIPQNAGQKSQFSHPPKNMNDRLKNEKSYIAKQKIALN